MQEIAEHKEMYLDFLVDDSIDELLTKLSHNGTWAGNIAAYAIANKLKITIKVYELKTELVILTINPKDSTFPLEATQTIELAYLAQCHYDAIVSVTSEDTNPGRDLWKTLPDILKNEASCAKWLLREGVFPSECECPKCHSKIALKAATQTYPLGYYYCGKCDRRKFPHSITLLNGLHLPIVSLIRLMICWLQNKDTSTTAQDSGVSIRSVVRMRVLLNAAAVRIIESTSKQIGGPDRIVEIDECNLPRAKYHIGRYKEEQWVVGGIMRPTSSSEQPAVFIVSVPDRKQDTLLKIIKTWVIPGSIIITDCWNGYIDLEEHGYHHFLVNHSQHFVDPESLAHTQRIESLWRWI